MYHAPIASGATTTGALAITGLNAAAYIVAAATLVFVGLALLRCIPRREA